MKTINIIWFRLNVLIAVPLFFILDLIISITTKEKIKNRRYNTNRMLNRIWDKY